MVSRELIEEFAASLVREYLSRKDCKSTLKTFEAEMPRTADSIGNRSQLAKEVHIEKIMRKNKDAEQSFRTMIEVIVKFLIERAVGSKEADNVPEQRSSTDLEKSSKRSNRPSSARRREHSSTSSNKEHTPTDIHELSGHPQADKGITSLNREPTTVVTIKSKPNVKSVVQETTEKDPYPSQLDDRGVNTKPSMSAALSSTAVSSSPKMEDDSSKRNVKRPGSASRNRGLAGPISSNLDAHERRRHHKNTKSNTSPHPSSPSVSSSLEEVLSSSKIDLSPSKKNTSSTSRDKLKSFGFDLSPKNSSDAVVNAPSAEVIVNNDRIILDDGLDGRASPVTKDGGTSRHRRSFDESAEMGGTGARSNSRHGHHDDVKSKPASGAVSQTKSTRKEMSRLGDLEMGDVDDLEEDLRDIQLGAYTPSSKKQIDCRPITLQLAMQLKSLLFGSSSASFNDEWRFQGLGFNEISDLAYGIVQHKGGPCGVLASVQACMLQKLLFGEDSNQRSIANLKEASSKRRTDCLIQAIADIVWRAGQKRSSVIALPSPRAHFSGGGRYKSDGLTETINLNLFKSREEIVEFVTGNIRAFTESKGHGCILLLFSAIFSRTIDMVIEDMDMAENQLLGAHGYCTQEMVNLILTGKASSNVFNDVMELGEGKDVTKLKGLFARSDVGLLSLFEHYKSCQVGTYYKTPRYPIWVVCSESHFSVLFSIKKELVSDWRAERHFDLYYYDGLANQQEEIRLTIDTTQSCPPADGEDLVPPLEHCIRTKWPDACINWNGTEPIL